MKFILKSTSNNLWDCVTSKEDLTSQKYDEKYVSVQFSSVQSLSRVRLFATP